MTSMRLKFFASRDLRFLTDGGQHFFTVDAQRDRAGAGEAEAEVALSGFLR